MHPNPAVLLVALASICAPRVAHGQALVVGSWSGSLTDQSGNTTPFTCSVRRSGDSLSIVLDEVPGVRPAMIFNEIRQVGDTLRFTIGGGEGPGVGCRLVRQEDGAYEGTCSNPLSGREGRMRMVPPPKE
jgi:hypothetical protein